MLSENDFSGRIIYPHRQSFEEDDVTTLPRTWPTVDNYKHCIYLLTTCTKHVLHNLICTEAYQIRYEKIK